MMENKEIILTKEDEGIRIDKILQDKFKLFSRSNIQRLIEKEKITVNGKTIKTSYKGKSVDKILIQELEAESIDLKPENIELEVLYEDNDIIVINKAKGMVVHPGNGNLNSTLVNAVLAKCEGSLSGIGGKIRPRNSA